MSPPRISFTMPSLRPAEALRTAQAVTESLQGLPHEIVVVCPEPVAGPNIVHVAEAGPSGNVRAHAAAYAVSRGDIVAAINDDTSPGRGFGQTMIEAVAAAEERHFPFCGGIKAADNPLFGTAYKLFFPYFPVMSRRSIERVGGWFDPLYGSHCGDADLALRAWWEGGFCQELPGVTAFTNARDTDGAHVRSRRGHFEQDFAAFRGRWHARLGPHIGKGVLDIFIDMMRLSLENGSFQRRDVSLDRARAEGSWEKPGSPDDPVDAALRRIDAFLYDPARAPLRGWTNDEFSGGAGYPPAAPFVRAEFRQLLERIHALSQRRTAMLIGPGPTGAAHIALRTMFDRVVTVAHDPQSVARLGASHPLDPARDLIVTGKSFDPQTVAAVRAQAGDTVDLLLINGGHLFHEVAADWVNYHPLVKSGGLIVFHDAAQRPARYNEFQVDVFLEWLTHQPFMTSQIERFGECLGFACYPVA